MSGYKIGDLITFNYPAPHKQGTRAHDLHPQVLILHDNWQGKVHGLNFNYLTEHEINFVKAVLNPEFAEAISKKDPSIRTQLERMSHMSATLNITSPHDFYVRFVKNFIKPRGYDPYRIYTPSKMTGVKVIFAKEVMVGDRKDGVFQRLIDKIKNFRGPRFT